MTRINAGIPPKYLTNRHLIAEHREIKRVPNQVNKTGYDPNSIPKQFSLGKGHVKFFYNKQKFLYDRYETIYQECIRRGFNVQYYGDAWSSLKDTIHWNDYHPTDADTRIIAERINERLTLKSSLLLNWNRLIDKTYKK